MRIANSVTYQYRSHSVSLINQRREICMANIGKCDQIPREIVAAKSESLYPQWSFGLPIRTKSEQTSRGQFVAFSLST